LKQKKNGVNYFIILEGEDLFQGCVLPICRQLLELAPEDFDVEDDEELTLETLFNLGTFIICSLML